MSELTQSDVGPRCAPQIPEKEKAGEFRTLLRIMAGVDKDFNGKTVMAPGFGVTFLSSRHSMRR